MARLHPEPARGHEMAKLNMLWVAVFIVGKGLLLESKGGNCLFCLKNPEKEDVSWGKKKRAMFQFGYISIISPLEL